MMKVPTLVTLFPEGFGIVTLLAGEAREAVLQKRDGGIQSLTLVCSATFTQPHSNFQRDTQICKAAGTQQDLQNTQKTVSG